MQNHLYSRLKLLYPWSTRRRKLPMRFKEESNIRVQLPVHIIYLCLQASQRLSFTSFSSFLIYLMWSTAGNGWLYGWVSETAPFHVRRQGTKAVLCQMGEWFSHYMSLATSQESFLKMKGHLLKKPLHFPKHKGSPLVLLGLARDSMQLLDGPQTLPAALDPLAHVTAAWVYREAPFYFGPFSKLAAFGCQHVTPKSGNTMSKIQRGLNSLCLANSL